jgi:ATP-dependent Zn protease
MDRIGALVEATSALVNQERDHVRSVADALLKKETLTGEQVGEILKRPKPRLAGSLVDDFCLERHAVGRG